VLLASISRAGQLLLNQALGFEVQATRLQRWRNGLSVGPLITAISWTLLNASQCSFAPRILTHTTSERPAPLRPNASAGTMPRAM
jgi:hypothetical protein